MLNFAIPSQSELFEQMQIRSQRARRSSMSLCTATDKFQTLENRLEAARTALSQWTIGSFEYENVLRQVPDLKNLLVVEVK